MISNFVNSVYNHAMNGFQKVSPEKKQYRLDICKTCEFFNENSYQCEQCGCFLEIKTFWASEKCPIDKWGPEIETSSQNDTSSSCGCNKK